MWGSREVNERGEFLLQFIINNALTIGNRGNVPTYIGPTSVNVLDVTVYTESDDCGIND